jgi:putative flippase GtrA
MANPQRFFRGWQISRLLRFAGVSLTGTIATHSMLWLMVWRWDWHGAPANLAAVSVVSVPGYLANRHWVWERDRGQHSFRGEVAPYWAMTLSGLVLSTVFAWLAYRVTPHAWAVSVANLAGFGVLWLAKFHLFDRFIFGGAPGMGENLTHELDA